LRQQLGLPVEQLQGAGTDRTETRNGDFQRRFHGGHRSLRMELDRELS
jgi:hypothetical protein